jgi:hypothetical protein
MRRRDPDVPVRIRAPRCSRAPVMTGVFGVLGAAPSEPTSAAVCWVQLVGVARGGGGLVAGTAGWWEMLARGEALGGGSSVGSRCSAQAVPAPP